MVGFLFVCFVCFAPVIPLKLPLLTWSMIGSIIDNINSGKMTSVAFIDPRKACDTVNHGMLIKKIRDIGPRMYC